MTLRDVLRRLEEIDRAESDQRKRLRDALVLDIERFLFVTEGRI